MSGYEIEVLNQQTLLTIDENRLQTIICHVLQEYEIPAAEIHVLLVDNATIHALNIAHLQHDFPTDVITFPLNDPGFEPPDYPLEGEIVISTEMAAELAESLQWSPLAETELYLIHGLLHLCGYDDLQEQAQQEMRQQEYRQLMKLGLKPSSEDQRWADCLIEE